MLESYCFDEGPICTIYLKRYYITLRFTQEILGTTDMLRVLRVVRRQSYSFLSDLTIPLSKELLTATDFSLITSFWETCC